MHEVIRFTEKESECLAMFRVRIRTGSGFNWSGFGSKKAKELRNEKRVITDENYGCKGQRKTMDARKRRKL